MSLIQVFLQEDFKFSLGREYQSFDLNLPHVLLTSIQGFFYEKHNGRENSIMALGRRRGKILFPLLYEVIAIDMRLTLGNI